MLGRFGQFVPESIIKHVHTFSTQPHERAESILFLFDCFLYRFYANMHTGQEVFKTRLQSALLFPSISKDLCHTIAPTRCVNSHNIFVSSRIY